MAVDSQLKRQSATCMLVPSLIFGAHPAEAPANNAGRWGATWMYAGIDIDPLGGVPDIVIFRRRIEGY